jgi:hypothetical protein
MENSPDSVIERDMHMVGRKMYFHRCFGPPQNTNVKCVVRKLNPKNFVCVSDHTSFMYQVLSYFLSGYVSCMCLCIFSQVLFRLRC